MSFTTETDMIISVIGESKYPIPFGELQRAARNSDIVYKSLTVASTSPTEDSIFTIDKAPGQNAIIDFSTDESIQWSISTDPTENFVFTPSNNGIDTDVIFNTGDNGAVCVAGSDNNICLQGSSIGNPVKIQSEGIDSDISIQVIPKGFGEFLVPTITGINNDNAAATKKYVDDQVVSGSGDVVGPVSANNNAIVRFDTGTGKLIKNSGVFIDDSNNVTGVIGLTASTISGSLTTASQTAITAIGTVVTGVWNATAVDVAHGGTGATSLTVGNVLVGNGTSPVTATKAAPSGAFVGTTDSQTLTNKTLTAPVISTIVNTGTLTLPTTTDTLVGRTTADTLTNKNLADATTTFYDDVTPTKQMRFEVSGVAAATTRILAVPDASGTLVLTDNSQTLVNKTLTAPVISTIVNTGTITLPTTTDTLVGRSTTDSLTNKSLADATTTFYDDATPTKQMRFEVSGVTAATTRTLTVPDASGTLVLTDAVQTLTGKTIDSGSNTITLDAASVTTGTLGVARGGTGASTLTSGNVLVGAGVGAVTTTKAAPSGDFVGTTDTQTLTGKTLGAVTISGIASVTDVTQSTSTTDGAVVVSGGVGIAKNLHVGGTTQFFDDVSLVTGKILTLDYTPSAATDAVNKGYVDSVGSGLVPKDAVVVATTGPLETNNYANGAAGLGATLTKTSVGAFPLIDSAALAFGQRILVKDEASALKNGVYTLTTVGDGLTPWQLTRATDMDTTTEYRGAYMFVSSGTTNGFTSWVCTNMTDPVVGTDDITLGQFSAANTATGANLGAGQQVYANNTGVTLNFRSIIGTSNRITATQNTNDITLNVGSEVGLTVNPLSQFASTTSTQLRGVISDETGTGSLVFGTSPTLVTPSISSIVNTGTITLPTATTTLVGRDTTDTLTNKTMTSSLNNLTASALFADNRATTVSVSAATAPSTGQVLTATSGTTATWQTPGIVIGTAFASGTPTLGAANRLIYSGTTNQYDWSTTSNLVRGSTLGMDTVLVADARGKKSIVTIDSASNFGGKIPLHPGLYPKCHLFMRDTTYVDKLMDGYNAPVYADSQAQAKLTPGAGGYALTGATGNFGRAIGMDYYGQTLVVGGPLDGSGVGAAWFYNRGATTATFSAAGGSKIIGTGAAGTAQAFGSSVAVSADNTTVVIGAPNDGTGGTANYGAIWVFGTTGTQLGAKLVGTGSAVGGERQGTSVAVSANADTIAVSGDGRSVWVYYKSAPSTWTQQTRINYNPLGAAPSPSGSWGSVALSSDGHTMALGTMGATYQTIYVYERNGGPSGGVSWTLVDSFTSSTGYRIAMSGDATTIIATDSTGGSANVFRRVEMPYDTYATDRGPYSWVQHIVTPSGTPGGGIAISEDASTVIIGDTTTGGAYIYLKEAGGLYSLRGIYPQTSYIVSGTGGVGSGTQGFTVATSGFGNVMVIGGQGDNTNVGAAWVFK